MLYIFKSKAGAEVLMLGADAAAVLGAMGRAPAPQGIFEVAELPHWIAQLQAAVKPPVPQAAALAPPLADAEEAEPELAVSLRQRAWPLLELLRAAQRAQEPVVWGV